MKHLLANLNCDLSNEYKHMLFYLTNAKTIRGHQALALSQLLSDFAASELEHVQGFIDLITSLGGTPTTDVAEFEVFDDPCAAADYAYKMEMDVSANFAARIQEVEALKANGGISLEDALYVQHFLQDQLSESRGEKAQNFQRFC